MSDRLIKVHDISQEYWFMRRTACSCGGRLEKTAQMLQVHEGIPVDRVMARCDACGEMREHLFDISIVRQCSTDMMHTAEITRSSLMQILGKRCYWRPGHLLPQLRRPLLQLERRKMFSHSNG